MRAGPYYGGWGLPRFGATENPGGMGVLWRRRQKRSPELLVFLSAVIPSHVGGRHIADTAYIVCSADVRILQ